MAFIGEVIYEDYVYKYTGKSKSILWGKGNPWRQKFFSIKRIGNKPLLEFFNKKPKNKNTLPKGKIDLWPSFRVEKVTNMKNRAYVFQVTTPDVTVCLSTDDQRSMDIFVFFLQIQCRLKDQIQDDFFPINPENSEAQRRIGAKGTDCLLHVSPFGITLALQSNRSVLAQWPLKSIRSYESSETGQLSLEAGRVAPMGDGLYIFNTEEGGDNMLYDLIDRYVIDALDQAQLGNHGGSEEIEDYVIEAERLLGLTVVSACTVESPDISHILQENWCTDIPNRGGSSRPQQIVHSRLTSSGSVGSMNSQISSAAQSVPARFARDASSPQSRGSPQIPRSLPPTFQHSPSPLAPRGAPGTPGGTRRGSNQSQSSLVDRPPQPLPPTTSTIPQNIPQRGLNNQGPVSTGPYLKMNASASRSDSSPGSPFTPTSADWHPPPSFRDVMRQKSTSPIAEIGPYNPDAYLHPASTMPSTSTPNGKAGNQSISSFNRDQYLTPLSVPDDIIGIGSVGAEASAASASSTPHHRFVKHHANVSPKSKSPKHGLTGLSIDQVVPSPKMRSRRLRSASCEDLSDYLRTVVYDPVSKSMNDLLDEHHSDEESDYMGPEPFPRLQSFSGVIERDDDRMIENYYNIEGLKGKIYDAPGLTVAEIRKRFSKRSQSRIRRSVSNPSFIGALSVERLNDVRISIGLMSTKDVESRSSTLKDMLPDALRRHLNKDGHHHGSHGALSSGAASSMNSSKASSRGSSRPNSAHNSPYNSLSRKNKTLNKDEIVATTSVKGINITRRSRSFRKQKTLPDSEPVKGHEKNGKLENQSNFSSDKGDHSNGTGAKGENNRTDNQQTLSKTSTAEDSVDLSEHNAAYGTNLATGSQVDNSVKLHKKGPTVFHKPKPAAKPKPAVLANVVVSDENGSATTTV